MLTKPVALVGLVAICGAAAGGGAYLAFRQNTSATAFEASDAPPVTAEAAASAKADLPAGAISETEAVIDPSEAEPARDARAASDRTSAPSPEPAPARVAPRARAARTAPSRSEATAPRQPAATESAPAGQPADPGWVGLERPWPSRDTTSTEAAPPVEATPAGRPVEPEPPPPPPAVEELVVPADSVIGLQIETPLTSERAKVEDRVEARVTRDVKVGDRVAIPAGTRVVGSVVLVERGGKIKERARLGVRFHTVVLADSTELPMKTETVYRDGASPAGESAAKIGGAAVGGAILGAILGGKKGAAVGGAAGAGAGTATVLAGDRNAATLPAGATLTVRLSAPVTVTVEE